MPIAAAASQRSFDVGSYLPVCANDRTTPQSSSVGTTWRQRSQATESASSASTRNCCRTVCSPGSTSSRQPSFVGPQRRGQPEGNHVRQAVVFLAKITFGAGHSCDPAIQAIHKHSDEQGDGGTSEITVYCSDNGIKTGKHSCSRHQVGQQDDPLAQFLFPFTGFSFHWLAKSHLVKRSRRHRPL